ncbi:hypothetical protein GDO86_007350 [Hymenochirus boettgeri]|uniref:Uncharacterized protein n=1 Tax=Hymenochirus boettgeri TaxID=247094 RepID=A0A8T2J1F8_9PIPI|nr:hypothetical protein GDO86_007350 [Hymenochirus boettgeri]
MSHCRPLVGYRRKRSLHLFSEFFYPHLAINVKKLPAAFIKKKNLLKQIRQKDKNKKLFSGMRRAVELQKNKTYTTTDRYKGTGTVATHAGYTVYTQVP